MTVLEENKMTEDGNYSVRLVYFILKRSFFVVYKYFIFPIAILLIESSILFLIIRFESSVHTGDSLVYALCVLDLVVSVDTVPNLIKLFFIDDGMEYFDHVSCVMLLRFFSCS